MFANYFRDRRRESPVNLATARVILGTYLVWNVASFDWGELAAWYVPDNAYAALYPPADHLVLPAEKWFLVASLVAFTVGYRVALTSFASAVVLSHLGVIMQMHSLVGRTDAMFVNAWLLIFFGIYRHTDALTVDAVRRGASRSTAELAGVLRSASDRSYDAVVLELSLLAVAVLYFGSAVYKARLGPLFEWTTAWNLGRLSILVQEELGYTWLGRLLLDYPFALWGAAWGTVVLEASLLVAVLLGGSITLVVLGLLGTHAVIALALGPFFLDQFVFLLLFASWDRLHDRFALDRRLDVVYDERCPFCVRSVYPFAVLDTGDALTLYSQRDVPDEYRTRSDVDLGSSLYVFDGDTAHAGFAAFRELARQYGALRPLARLLDVGPAERLGDHLYRALADHRTHHFASDCAGGERAEPTNT